LFEGAEGFAVEFEIDLAEAAARGAFYGVGASVEDYGGEILEHGLAKDGEEGVFESGGHAIEGASDNTFYYGRNREPGPKTVVEARAALVWSDSCDAAPGTACCAPTKAKRREPARCPSILSQGKPAVHRRTTRKSLGSGDPRHIVVA